MPSIESRCTQCGNVNTNSVPKHKTNHGGGSAHGTETVFCGECSDTCNLDECTSDEPCDRCYTETIQNRCGKSVPTAQGR